MLASTRKPSPTVLRCSGGITMLAITQTRCSSIPNAATFVKADGSTIRTRASSGISPPHLANAVNLGQTACSKDHVLMFAGSGIGCESGGLRLSDGGSPHNTRMIRRENQWLRSLNASRAGKETRFLAETSGYLCDHENAPRFAVRRRSDRTTASADHNCRANFKVSGSRIPVDPRRSPSACRR